MRKAATTLVLTSVVLLACKGSMGKIEAVRDALEKDDASSIKSAVEGYPACVDAPPVALLPTQPAPRDTGCLADIATALGSKKGFAILPPDQAATTTVAIVLLRDGRGDWIAHPESWLSSLKGGKGTGPDALRLAVARRMAEAAPNVGRTLETDSDARAALKGVAGAIPGACPTYWLLGTGTDPNALAPEHSAEHASCVHKDLQRREGPGGGYGEGIFRALEGSLALWRETERALRLGLPNMAPAAKATLEAKLKVIEPATQAIATKKLATTTTAANTEMLGEVHAEAGVVLWSDAGARDGGADGGAPPRAH
jgi:hypothetical protein